jgi:GDPmannose 4,6-dehydratase
MKKALITGISGQDGHHLATLLIDKGYEVTGLINGQGNSKQREISERFQGIELRNGDLADFSSLLSVLDETRPDEIYNLGAISFVGLSFQQPELTANITGLGPLRILEATRKLNLDKTRIYQASSSEMYGKVQESPQKESTPFYPRSPYGVAKCFAHHICVNYRESYGMHVSCGILFNHEGPYRGYEFVTRKITSSVARIKLGKIKSFSLGSLEPQRDWGYAGDYVEAMWIMLQQDVPDDYVIATGKKHSVREFVEAALLAAELDVDVDKYVTFDPSNLRPAEVDVLVGDASKALKNLGWKPQTDFHELVRLMVENDMRIESQKSN